MMGEELDIVLFSAIGLIVVLLTARIVKARHGSFFGSFLAAIGLKKGYDNDRMFKTLRVPALKKCPNCAGELPLSALICDACDYNFLAGSVYRGHKMLPAPEPIADQRSNRVLASAEI